MSQTLTDCDSPAAAGAATRPRASGEPTGPRLRPSRAALLVTFTGLIALAIGEFAIARDTHSNPWLLSWIPVTCCVTNDCCWQISERELVPMSNDRWQVRSTGEVRTRTDWSPDGKFYRCACDYDSGQQHWVRHQGANTRCLFVPMRTVSR